jgi:hypothetical protein
MQNFKSFLKEGKDDVYLMDLYPKLKGSLLDCPFEVPKIVKGQFAVNSNELTSLEGGPKEVHGDYFCQYNQLTSLKFCALKINSSLYCHNNPIENLQGIGKQYSGVYIKSVLYLPESITSHILGLLQINQLRAIAFMRNSTAFARDRTLISIKEIIDKHLKSDRDILECQEELITNKLSSYAKL